MPTYTVTVEAPEGANPLTGTTPLRTRLRLWERFYERALSGMATTSGTRRARVAAGTAQASGTLTLSSASGTVGGTINGQAVTVAASGGDTATAAALANAINASAHAAIKNIVLATASGAVVKVWAAQAGAIGNAITLAASGTGVTAGGLSGGKLSGGTSEVLTR